MQFWGKRCPKKIFSRILRNLIQHQGRLRWQKVFLSVPKLVNILFLFTFSLISIRLHNLTCSLYIWLIKPLFSQFLFPFALSPVSFEMKFSFYNFSVSSPFTISASTAKSRSAADPKRASNDVALALEATILKESKRTKAASKSHIPSDSHWHTFFLALLHRYFCLLWS